MADETDPNPTNTEAAIDAGEQIAGVAPRVMWLEHPDNDANRVPAVLTDIRDGATIHRRVELGREILAVLDDRQPGPRRRNGVRKLVEVESFMDFAQMYGTPGVTLIYAMPSLIVAVLDEHGMTGDAAWRGFRAEFAPPTSLEWAAWCAHDGKALAQDVFADFIESRLEDVTSEASYPSPAELLTMARDLTVRTTGTFQRQVDPTTGAGVLVSRVDNEPANSTIIPRAFVIGVPVYENGERYRVEARVRLSVKESRATFTYTLHRRREIERDAFMGLRKRIAEAGFRVLAGHP